MTGKQVRNIKNSAEGREGRGAMAIAGRTESAPGILFVCPCLLKLMSLKLRSHNLSSSSPCLFHVVGMFVEMCFLPCTYKVTEKYYERHTKSQPRMTIIDLCNWNQMYP